MTKTEKEYWASRINYYLGLNPMAKLIMEMNAAGFDEDKFVKAKLDVCDSFKTKIRNALRDIKNSDGNFICGDLDQQQHYSVKDVDTAIKDEVEADIIKALKIPKKFLKRGKYNATRIALDMAERDLKHRGRVLLPEFEEYGKPITVKDIMTRQFKVERRDVSAVTSPKKKKIYVYHRCHIGDVVAQGMQVSNNGKWAYAPKQLWGMKLDVNNFKFYRRRVYVVPRIR